MPSRQILILEPTKPITNGSQQCLQRKHQMPFILYAERILLLHACKPDLQVAKGAKEEFRTSIIGFTKQQWLNLCCKSEFEKQYI